MNPLNAPVYYNYLYRNNFFLNFLFAGRLEKESLRLAFPIIAILTFSTDSFNFFSADLYRRVIHKTALIIEIIQQIKHFFINWVILQGINRTRYAYNPLETFKIHS